MDNNIKEENPKVSNSDLSELHEKNLKIGIKSSIVDDRYDDINLLGKENFYKNTFNRRPSYPWEDSTLKEKKYSDEEIAKIKKVYSTKKEVEKITLQSATLIKADIKSKGQIIINQPASGYTNQSTVPYSYNGKHDYFNTSYPNGWPLLRTVDGVVGGGKLSVDYIPGLDAKATPIQCESSVLPIFFNLFYDLNILVEPLKDTSCFNFRHIIGYENADDHWSTHASGTAIDFNPTKHPLGKANTFSVEQRLTIRTLIKKYGITWGGDWPHRPDDMHFEIKVSPNVALQLIESNGLIDRMSKIKTGIKVF